MGLHRALRYGLLLRAPPPQKKNIQNTLKGILEEVARRVSVVRFGISAVFGSFLYRAFGTFGASGASGSRA